ncbi:hypothetical protein [Fodinicurvata fenggangensis]|uniref:hypothetical protein n=1 Tax=Fodinicurvata fenggangensis TaxID=1121830 RepID=UPI0012DE680D|nr:hypothetical protein [Fodinicurvata fenggangensis]
MQYLPIAFEQLEFSRSLLNCRIKGKINIDEVDNAINKNQDGPLKTLKNNLTITFGAAAITLNRVREELNIPLPETIDSENDQCVSLIYQIRNAFAHDIAEPKWWITKERFRREYRFGRMHFDLTDLHGTAFNYEHIHGIDTFFCIKEYFENEFDIFYYPRN